MDRINKELLIKEFIEKDFELNEIVDWKIIETKTESVKIKGKKALQEITKEVEYKGTGKIIEIVNDFYLIKCDTNYQSFPKFLIEKDDCIRLKKENLIKNTYDIGYKPNFVKPIYYQDFTTSLDTFYCRFFESVSKINFNPFVNIKGKIIYYQRDYEWDLEDEQNLLESLYQNIPIGKFVFRKRPYEWAKKNQLDVFEVIDGKQRLTALKRFFENEFCDKQGYYWKDFSDLAKYKFLSLSVNQCITPQDISDEDIIDYFFRINTFGKILSNDHLKRVKQNLYE